MRLERVPGAVSYTFKYLNIFTQRALEFIGSFR